MADNTYEARRKARREAAIETARINSEFAQELRKALGWDHGRIEDQPKED